MLGNTRLRTRGLPVGKRVNDFSARLPFDKIPERGAFDSLPDSNSASCNSTASCFAQYSHFHPEASYSFVDELAKRGHVHEALKFFRRINGLGLKPTKYNLCTLLNSCAKSLNLHLGLQIHAQIIQNGHEENLILNSTLVHLYAKCESVNDAKRVFASIKRHDQVSWTSIISGFSQNGYGREALILFKEMLDTDIKPNCFTFTCAISACKGLETAAQQGTVLHAYVIKLGFESSSFVASSLIDCYSKCGKLDHALSLFDATMVRDNIVFNSMITGYSQNLLGEMALNLFRQMRVGRVSPTNYTFATILNACGSLTVVQQGRQMHSMVTKVGMDRNMIVISSLIDMYSKCGSIDEAHQVFDQTIEKDSIMGTSMITGYAQCGRGQEGLDLFEYLVSEHYLIPDHICFTAVLTACNHAGFLDKGVEYFNKMTREYGLVPELDQYACLVDLYARNGHLRKAKELMEEMPFDPNAVMWSSFLASCRVYREVELGKEAANKLINMEPYNPAPYVMLANIYAESGMLSESMNIWKMMKQKGIRKSAGWSWVEVDKTVHVFLAGKTSHPQSQEIYMELDTLYYEMREVA